MSDAVTATTDSRAVLVNFWSYTPIGHAIEALRYCLGYHRADPSRPVSLVLNAATATELAALCPFIEQTYSLSVTRDDDSDAETTLLAVPRTWDYILDDGRGYGHEALDLYPQLHRYYAASKRYFCARRGRGIAGSEPPEYEPNQQLRLELPSEARQRARRELAGARVRIAVMVAGSGRRAAYPSESSWRLILGEFAKLYPDALFCLIGKLNKDDRTSTRFTRPEVDRLAAVCPRVVDCFDQPLVDQLGVVEGCDVFISPHTGFGMSVLAVGTPWLTLSGGRWPEYFFNSVPFYSVLPDPDCYPCYSGLAPVAILDSDEDGEGKRIPSMSRARIVEDLPELLEAAKRLIEGRLSHHQALDEHFARMLAFYRGDRSRIQSFDNIHAKYV